MEPSVVFEPAFTILETVQINFDRLKEKWNPDNRTFVINFNDFGLFFSRGRYYFTLGVNSNFWRTDSPAFINPIESLSTRVEKIVFLTFARLNEEANLLKIYREEWKLQFVGKLAQIKKEERKKKLQQDDFLIPFKMW